MSPHVSFGAPLIDSHLHLWDPTAWEYPWLYAEPALHRSFLPSDLDPGECQPEGVVVVEAGCGQAEAELKWLGQLAESWPSMLGVVAQVPLERGPDAAALLAQAAGRPLTVGVRRNAQDEAPGFLLAEPMVAGVRMLADHDLPFDACVREYQIRELTQLVDRCPDVTFVLDHLGKPSIAERRGRPWLDDLAALAKRSNVVAKLSGLTTEADHQRWRAAEVMPYLAHAIDAFGSGRCMFGSDWPVSTLATTYQRWVEIVLAATAGLTGHERAAILGGTALRVYHLDLGNHRERQ